MYCVYYLGFQRIRFFEKKWILATKRLNFVPSKHSFICANHFHQTDFETHCEITKLKKDKRCSSIHLRFSKTFKEQSEVNENRKNTS